MVELIEKSIPFRVSPEENCPILLAQLPNQLRHQRFLYQVADPDQKWVMVRPILEMVASTGRSFWPFQRARSPFVIRTRSYSSSMAVSRSIPLSSWGLNTSHSGSTGSF